MSNFNLKDLIRNVRIGLRVIFFLALMNCLFTRYTFAVLPEPAPTPSAHQISTNEERSPLVLQNRLQSHFETTNDVLIPIPNTQVRPGRVSFCSRVSTFALKAHNWMKRKGLGTALLVSKTVLDVCSVYSTYDQLSNFQDIQTSIDSFRVQDCSPTCLQQADYLQSYSSSAYRWNIASLGASVFSVGYDLTAILLYLKDSTDSHNPFNWGTYTGVASLYSEGANIVASYCMLQSNNNLPILRRIDNPPIQLSNSVEDAVSTGFKAFLSSSFFVGSHLFFACALGVD